MRVPDPVDRYVVPLFWNRESCRPRLPYRFGLAFALFLVVGSVYSTVVPALDYVVVAAFGLVRVPGGAAAAAIRLLLPVIGTALVCATVYLAGRLFDRRRFRDFGFRLGPEWYRDLAAGLALGALLMTGVFLVQFALGWVAVTGTFETTRPGGFWIWFLTMAVTFAGVGVYEELLVRGYLLTNVAEGLQVGPVDERLAVGLATLFTAGVFGLLHALNPNAGLASTVGISLAGVLLGLGYVLTGELALPIGFHVTWNAFQGLVYGFPVSGLSIGVRLLAVEQSGPGLWTGGRFGPEAGLIGILAVLAGCGLTVAYARYTGRGGIDEEVARPELRWRRG